MSLKVVILGDGGVGKTSIAKRYLSKGYFEEYLRTLGTDFYTRTQQYNFEEGTFTFEWVIWGLSGQPSFSEIRGSYYKGAKGGIVVYDVTRPVTFYNLPNWIREFFERGGGIYPVVLVANKIDLIASTTNGVPPKEGKTYANELSNYIGLNIPHMTASAKKIEISIKFSRT